MDKEQLREQFLKRLKELQLQGDIPQPEIDKVILDYDSVAGFLDDEAALKRYAGQLIDGAAYRANMINPLEDYDGPAYDAQTQDRDIPNEIDEQYAEEMKDKPISDEELKDAVTDWEYERSSDADLPYTESADGVRLEGELVDELDEFDKIVNNEMTTHWWRYHDNWDEESKDYMERYTTGDLTDEEMKDLQDQQTEDSRINQQIRDAKDQYEAELEESAKSAGITDTKGFRALVQAGTKILQAIDEELIYSPLLLAERGLNKLGLGLAGKAVGGLTRAALVYEDFLFKANVGIAALAHGSLGMEGTASRLPSDIANGILGLYGAGMPEQIVPEVEGGMSKEEQAKRHKTMFANQMYQYSRMSPSFRLFTDVIGPKTGITDPLQGWKNFGKMLGGNE